MLEIKNITKTYHTASLSQTALDDVSLNFRDGEFVAVLGQSGSGKTTLLNVIGGLDGFDQGELVIDGKTTKLYKDKDWDYYRNHMIGFVFQSYNLIPHLSVLANVEIALTINGAGAKVKKEKAIQALKDVGLYEHRFKKPSELSGGQMQRVAIARALVNDPRIVLADEPTGALDSLTSVQVMELLKKVSRDRLVIMVTHNPELASQYANRIVEIKDGKIFRDSNPLSLTQKNVQPAKKGKSAMSFLTALQLSFQNLKTKKARTTLVSVAGSIGIIGIALILSLSNGVQTYINKTEKETMAQYPLQITSTGFNLDDVIQSRRNSDDTPSKDGVKAMDTLSNSMSYLHENDLSSLKTYLNEHERQWQDKVQDITFSYGVTPAFFQIDHEEVYPLSANSDASMMMFESSAADFFALPYKPTLYENDYDVKDGRWPKSEDELVLVLNENGEIADTLLYALGLKSREEYAKIQEALQNDEVYKISDDQDVFDYQKFYDLRFFAVPTADVYGYSDALKMYTDERENSSFMKQKIQEGYSLHIVGIAQPKKSDTPVSSLSTGIGYMPSLNIWAIEKAKSSDLVQKQLNDPTTNVFTNEKFNQTNIPEETSTAPTMPDIDFSDIRLPSINADIMQELLSSLRLNFTTDDIQNLLQTLYTSYTTTNASLLQSFQKDIATYLYEPSFQTSLQNFIRSLISQNPSLSPSSLQSYVQDIFKDFDTYIKENPTSLTNETNPLEAYLSSSLGQASLQAQSTKLIDALSNIKLDETTLSGFLSDTLADYDKYAKDNQKVTISAIQESLSSFLEDPSVQNTVYQTLQKTLRFENTSDIINRYIASYSQDILLQISNKIEATFASYMESMAGTIQLSSSSLTELLKSKQASSITSLISTMSDEKKAYENNLQMLGYADVDKPTSVSIYPKDFASKTFIKSFLDTYNSEMIEQKQNDKVIVYTDFVATMMSEISKIIDSISYVLIAFVGISLVVSSLMIGVITYISVLERRKEIGILRALGASKHNITQVFNAETFIIGLFAGILGIFVTLILLLPINNIIHAITENPEINASLHPFAAIALILLSIGLTLVAGIIPSKKAAKSDPVTALRTE